VISKITYCAYNEQIFTGTEDAEQLIFNYCKEKKYDCYQLSNTHFIFYRVRKWYSLGQEISIDTENGYWEVLSRQIFPTFYDFSANFFNVRDFVAYIRENTESADAADENTDESLMSDSPDNTTSIAVITNTLEEPLQYDITTGNNTSAPPEITESIPPPVETPRFLAPIDFVSNRPPYYANLMLIVSLLLVYGLMVLSSQTGHVNRAVMRTWGANHDLFVSNGEIHRLITSIFLHSDIMHVLGNIIVLFLIGGFIEKWVSSKFYIIHFISIGFFAASLSFYFHDGGFILGASSAAFGLLGLLFFALLRKQFPRAIIPTILSIAAFLSVDLVMITLHWDTYIDHTGHLAGLSFGFIYGIIYDYSNRKAPFKKNLRILFAPLLTASVAMLIVLSKPTDFKEWEHHMKKAELYYENGNFILLNYHLYRRADIPKEVNYALECFADLNKTIDSLQHLRVPAGYKKIPIEAFTYIEERKDLLLYLKESKENYEFDVNEYENRLKKLRRR
jgi:rhomboid protease GluP